MATHSSVLAWRIPGMGDPGMCIKYKQEALTIIFSPVKSQQSTVTKTLGPGAKWALEPGFVLIFGLPLPTIMVLDKLIYLSELLLSISVKYHVLVICWWCLVAKSCPILVTSWTIAHQAPLSMGFPRQEYWSMLPFPNSRGSSQPKD